MVFSLLVLREVQQAWRGQYAKGIFAVCYGNQRCDGRS